MTYVQNLCTNLCYKLYNLVPEFPTIIYVLRQTASFVFCSRNLHRKIVQNVQLQHDFLKFAGCHKFFHKTQNLQFCVLWGVTHLFFIWRRISFKVFFSLFFLGFFLQDKVGRNIPTRALYSFICLCKDKTVNKINYEGGILWFLCFFISLAELKWRVLSWSDELKT